jgi:hypothetical protein
MPVANGMMKFFSPCSPELAFQMKGSLRPDFDL